MVCFSTVMAECVALTRIPRLGPTWAAFPEAANSVASLRNEKNRFLGTGPRYAIKMEMRERESDRDRLREIESESAKQRSIRNREDR